MRGMVAVGMLVALGLVAAPARASEGGGHNECPYAQDLTLNLDGKKVVVGQAQLTTGGGQFDVDNYEFSADANLLQLRITGPRGEAWQVPMTRLVAGKRCSAVVLGNPVKVGAH